MTCNFLLSQFKNELFLTIIVSYEENWIMYHYVKRRRTVCRTSESPASISKSEFDSKKVLLSVWYTTQGLIHWKILSPKQSINDAFYYLQLDGLWSSLFVKRCSIISQYGIIFHNVNVSLMLLPLLGKCGWVWLGSSTPPSLFSSVS